MRRINKSVWDDDKLTKLFNMGFHPMMFYVFPTYWLISLPVNFVADSIVLLIGFKIYGQEKVWFNWKKSIFKSWLFGYAADIVAALILLAFEVAAGIFRASVIGQAFTGVLPFLCTLIPVLVAGVLIYFFNLKIALRKTELDENAKEKVALLMAIVTMPYLFFLPIKF